MFYSKVITLCPKNIGFFIKPRTIHHSCKILVVGGGTGGCSIAAKFAKKFKNQVIVIEPNQVHYYQPLFTLIGGGISSFDSSKRQMKDVLPKQAKWLNDSVIGFEPKNNKVITRNGNSVQYDIMIVAMGLQMNWNQIPGLAEALKDPESQVCSIYGPDTVPDVFQKLKKSSEGNAVFTFPNTPVKCPGAPQKIMYITEHYYRKTNVRNQMKIIYNTSLPVIFGAKKYADSLWDVCKNRNILVNLQTNLVEINPVKKEAKFVKLTNPNETIMQEYTLLHVCPPMGPPQILQNHSDITNDAGFLCVDPIKLQHIKYSNIFGIGDCTSTPNSKTMAAIAAQGKVLYQNVLDELNGKPMTMEYNGYASCPLVTGYDTCILAEFDYKLQPLETFPIDQGKEYYSMFLLKKYVFPFLYWNFMLEGLWNGPEYFRKLFMQHLKKPTLMKHKEH